MEGRPHTPLKFLPICEGNRLSALILDYAYTFSLILDRVQDDAPFRIETEKEYTEYYFDTKAFQNILHYSEVSWEGHLEYSNVSALRSKLLPLFLEVANATNQEMLEAPGVLDDNLRFLNVVHSGPEWDEKEPFALECTPYHRLVIDRTLSQLQEAVPIVPLPPPPFDRARERRVVSAQNARARRMGQLAILTLDEWEETLRYFDGRCAFNPVHPYQVLEHFYPLSGGVNGRGTSAFNCIPSCVYDNVTKGDRLPNEIDAEGLKRTIPEIQMYLEERRDRWLKQNRGK